MIVHSAGGYMLSYYIPFIIMYNIYIIYIYILRERERELTSWPLVGNEGMNPQYTNVKVDSLIPY